MQQAKCYCKLKSLPCWEEFNFSVLAAAEKNVWFWYYDVSLGSDPCLYDIEYLPSFCSFSSFYICVFVHRSVLISQFRLSSTYFLNSNVFSNTHSQKFNKFNTCTLSQNYFYRRTILNISSISVDSGVSIIVVILHENNTNHVYTLNLIFMIIQLPGRKRTLLKIFK